MTTPPDPEEVVTEFRHVVNMTNAALRNWLRSRDSRSVGMTPQGAKVTEPSAGESVGHHMGGRILAIRDKPRRALSDQDLHDMRKVIGYVHRHIKQRPKDDIDDTRWRKSLMNWGHDPVK